LYGEGRGSNILALPKKGGESPSTSRKRGKEAPDVHREEKRKTIYSAGIAGERGMNVLAIE